MKNEFCINTNITHPRPDIRNNIEMVRKELIVFSFERCAMRSTAPDLDNLLFLFLSLSMGIPEATIVGIPSNRAKPMAEKVAITKTIV